MIAYDFDGTLIKQPDDWKMWPNQEKRMYAAKAFMCLNITQEFIVITARGHNNTQLRLLEPKLKTRYGDLFKGIYLLKSSFKNKTTIMAHKLDTIKEHGITEYYDNEADILEHIKRNAPEVKLFLVENTGYGAKFTDYR